VSRTFGEELRAFHTVAETSCLFQQLSVEMLWGGKSDSATFEAFSSILSGKFRSWLSSSLKAVGLILKVLAKNRRWPAKPRL
jgi:hypothetical protein